MTRALALVAATPLRWSALDSVRFIAVSSCAMALILAEKALPLL